MSEEEDCPNSAYVTQVQCLKAHMKLEHRLTRVEALNALTLIAAVASFLSIIFLVWRP